MTGLDFMYSYTYHPHDAIMPTSTPIYPTPVPKSSVAHPGHEVPWDSPIEPAGYEIPTYNEHGHTHPGHEAPWDSPIESLPELATSFDPKNLHTHSDAHPGHEAPWDSPIEPASFSMEAYSKQKHAHPGHEAPWDSPIAPLTPTLQSQNPAHHYDYDWEHHEHEHEHVSGTSSPYSTHDYQNPWDSPIFDLDHDDSNESGTLTPLSEIDEDEPNPNPTQKIEEYLSKEVAAACFSPHPRSLHDTTKTRHPCHPSFRALLHSNHHHNPHHRRSMSVVQPLTPANLDKVSHHAVLSPSNGRHFAFAQRGEGYKVGETGEGCRLRDSNSRAEFLWHVSGVCGCGYHSGPALVEVMTPMRTRRGSFCER